MEIFIENISVNEIIEWLIDYFFVDDQIEIDEGVFKLKCRDEIDSFPVIVTTGIEKKNLTGVWFNTKRELWDNPVQCAEEASNFLSVSVLCDPGSPQLAPTQLLKVNSNSQEIINIENT